MITENMRGLIKNGATIRAMFEEGKELSRKYGNENVYDFLITARNNRGSDSVHLKIEVSGKASIFPFINSNVD